MRWGIDRNHLLLGSLQSPYHHGAYPLQKFKAERMVFFAVFPQNRALEEDGTGWLDGAGGELPDVWRKHPRPSEQISSANRFYHQRFTNAAPAFDHDLASLDQVTPIREFPFTQDRLSRFELSCHRAIRK
jgi:hypothetical protein